MPKRPFSFTFSLGIAFVSLVVALILVILSFIYYENSINTKALLFKITEATSKLIIQETKTYIHKTDTELKLLVHNNKDQKDIITKNKDININIMKYILDTESQVSSVFLSNKNGELLEVEKHPKNLVRVVKEQNNKRVELLEYKDKDFNTIKTKINETDYDPREHFWYKETNKSDIFISEPYIFDFNHELGITLSYPSMKEKRKHGVAALDISLNGVEEFILKESKKIKSDIALIDDNSGKILAISTQNNVKIVDGHKKLYHINDKDLPSSALIEASKKYFHNTHMGEFEYNNEMYVFDWEEFEIGNQHNWSIIILTPEKTILAEVEQTIIKTVGIVLIIVFIFMVIIIVVAKRISKPIIKISDDMRSLQTLDLDIDISNTSYIKEINQVQNSMSSLRSGLTSFKKYLPSDLVLELIKVGKVARIGGEEKKLAIMFTDIKGFTTISETMSPEELTSQLSEYLDEMSEIIMENEGTIDKYIGDAIMAFWGAPLDIEDPVQKAVKCAIQMQKRLDELEEKWEKEAKVVFKTRIGIHYGKTLVGNVGSSKRLNYTIIGDNVNVAARLESINKEFGTSIMISDIVNNMIKDQIKTTFQDEILLKGKTSKSKIYSVDL